MSLERLLLAAWIDGLAQKPPIRPTDALIPRIRLDDTGRAPLVPLPRTGGPR